MKIIDISVSIEPRLHVYEGDPQTRLEPWTRVAAGDVADVSRLTLGTHTGTHVDAPSHFLPGRHGVDRLDLQACIGPAQVIDLTDRAGATIDVADVEPLLDTDAERVIFKTRNSLLWRRPEVDTDFVALTSAAARLLVARGVRLAGIDYLSIAPAGDPATVHRILLEAGIVILEGLDLIDVVAGRYTLLCLPVRLAGADGAPARAVLISEE